MTQIRDSDNRRDYSAEWLHLLVQSALDAVVTMDSSGRIIAFNPAAERIFGYTKEKAIGRMVSDLLIPPQYRCANEKGLSHLLASNKDRIIGRRIETVAMKSDRSTFPVEVEVITVNPSKSPVFMAYIRDISEQKQAAQERLQYINNIKKTLLQTILAVSRTIEIRDPYTAGHQRRVANLAASIAEVMGLSGERLEGIFLGPLIHDIGKITVPAEILSRPGKLSDEDVHYLQIHCMKGYEILKPVEFPWPIAEIALQHHEHLDGSGYPQGLRSNAILQEAKIVCVADVVEALTSHRPYRPAVPLRKALVSLSAKAGTWYDVKATAACIDLFRNGYHIDAANLDEIAWLCSPP